MSIGITRRGFLKGCTAGAIGLALGIPKIQAFSTANAAETLERKELKGFCQMCKHTGCGNIITVENGVMVDVRGNPDWITNQGTLCGKGKSAIFQTYNPYRVKAPMRRTNPKKGLNEDPQWKEISWDEALQEVADKVRQVHQTDPNGFIIMTGFGQNDFTLRSQFAPAIGGGTDSTTKGQFCAIHYGLYLTMNNGITITDYKYNRFLLAFGRSNGINASYSQGDGRGLVYALKHGQRLVCVDPICTTEASMGEWIPIKPATDTAMVFAMLREIIYNLEYDKTFVRDRTNAPYLIDGQGNYLRSGNGKSLLWDLADKQVKEFDDPTLTNPAVEGSYMVKGVSYRPAFDYVKKSFESYTCEWASEICTVPADTIRKLAADFVEAAMIGSTIEIEGHIFPYRPACAIGGRGTTNHEDGTINDLGVKMLNILIGAPYVPGGLHGVSIGDRLKTDANGVILPGGESIPCTSFKWPPTKFDLFEVYPHRHSTNTVLHQVINEGPEKWGIQVKPQLLFISGGNPVLVNGSHEMCAEALSKIPYTVTFAYHFDESAHMSDMLLAANSLCENAGFYNYQGNECSMSTGEDKFFAGTHTGRFYRNPVDKIYNTMDSNDMAIEIFDKAGMLAQFNASINRSDLCRTPIKDELKLDLTRKYTFEELLDISIRNTHNGKYTIKDLKEKAFVPVRELSEKESYSSYYNNSGRYQIYFESQKRSGDFLLPKIKEHIGDPKPYMGFTMQQLEKYYAPVLKYEPILIHQAPAEYPYYGVPSRLPMSFFRCGATDQNPLIIDWNETYNAWYNSIVINTSVAEKLGFKEGDIIIAESQAGKTQGKVHITELIQPDTVGFPGATGRFVKSMGEKQVTMVCYNKLLDGHAEYCNPIHGGIETTARIKLYKA